MEVGIGSVPILDQASAQWVWSLERLPQAFSCYHSFCSYLRFLKSDCALCACWNPAQFKNQNKIDSCFFR